MLLYIYGNDGNTIVTPLKAAESYQFKAKEISMILLVCLMVIKVLTLG